MSTGRKVFHCAVDETALTTNISEIKKWTTNGSIDLIVPLYTLERLHALKRAGSQTAINAREAVRFLDRVTSGKDTISPDRVELQGPNQLFEHWEDAEKFFLPEFEEEPEAVTDEANAVADAPRSPTKQQGITSASASDDLSQMLLSRLNFKKDPEATSNTSAGSPSGPASRTSSRSSRTSPECAQHENGTSNKSEKGKAGHQRTVSASTIPVAPAELRPLLSALLWRLHSGPDGENSAKGCILVSNDRATQIWAQKFGIGVKNIVQLRTAIQYEEREYKNRCKYVEKTQTQTQAPEPKTLLSYEDESDEDELVFVPRGRGNGKGPSRGPRGGASRKAAAKVSPPAATEPPTTAIEVPTQPIDPNSFSRSIGGAKAPPVVDLSAQQGGGRGNAASRRGSNGRRGGASRGSSRGAPRGAARGNGRGRGKLWVP
ncbi:hypothetical protein N7513_001688 [Penicillium frequentans]|uniref:PIN domain-containing protein n=1 Tax=Penicillium frequentans TaxID=3151616 RepID=A0AAD6CPP1_9EURO|nr:hypothetical protein N7494_008481 [Penicillium glabrum]KAJ5565446.1 hypothetical protein N7513_001688 [Penicillium glabrum]